MKWVKVFRSVCLFSIFPCVCSKFPLEYLIYFEECRFTLLAISVHLLSFWGTTETIYWGLLFNFTLLLDLFPPYCCLGRVKFLWKLIAGSEKMEPFDVLSMGNISNFHLDHSNHYFETRVSTQKSVLKNMHRVLRYRQKCVQFCWFGLEQRFWTVFW